jgi:predicted dehydrogenase
VRTVLVGAGAIARQHLACLSTVSTADVIAVCDRSPATARAAAERFGIPRWSSDYINVLAEERPDVVHITTPPSTHFELALDALSRGAHVIVEKPITTRPDELRELISVAERRRVLLIENYNYIYNRPVQRVLARVRDGSFGQVVHVEVEICLDILGETSPYLDRGAPMDVVRMPGGPIADFLPHLASLAHAFVGRHVRASTVWQRREQSILSADEFRGLVTGENDATALLSFSSHSQPDAFFIRVYGTRMRAAINLFDGRLTIERLRSMPRPLVPVVNGAAEAYGVGRAAIGGLMGKLSGGPGAYEGLWTLLHKTYASISEGARPPVSISQILEVNGLIAELVSSGVAP